MTEIIFKAKNKQYQFKLQKGEDFLISLDKFLKKNKIDRSEIEDLKANFSLEESLISRRIILITIKTIKLAKEVN